jgi:endonuclease YncB( thermonuclease family)
MRLYFIAIFVAISLLFHQNCLYANAGKTDTKGGSQDQNTGEDHFRRGNDDTLSNTNTSSNSNTSLSRTNSSSSNTSSSSNYFSTNNTTSGNSRSSTSDSLSSNNERQSSQKKSSGTGSLSSKKSGPVSGYINIPNLAGSEVVSNIPEKNEGIGKSVKVVEVTDGDSFTCILDKKEVAIRLYGIDAPENGQTFSVKSKDYLKQILDRKNVQIKIVENDRYGKSVALVYADKVNVNETLVKNGVAWVCPQYCKLIFCKEWNNYQQIAKALKMSLWEEREPVPPWEYR